MNKQIFDNIKTTLINLIEEFDYYISNSKVFAKRISISVTELYANEKDNLKELKLDLFENELEFDFDKLKLVLKNLIFLNNYLANKEINQFIEGLQNFNKYFLKLDEIWKTIDWRYYYDIFNSQLLIYSRKRTLLNTANISDISNIIEKLTEFITEKSRTDYEKHLIKEIKAIKTEIQPLLSHLDFIRLFSELHKEITNSLTKSLEIQWNELISKSELSKSDIVVLAFILRLSIENQLKNHTVIIANNSPIKMLGNIFSELQKNRIFVSEKNDILKYKKLLDETIHGERDNLTRTEFIEIKEYFKSLLSTQNLNLF
jgi:hypothetical protein